MKNTLLTLLLFGFFLSSNAQQTNQTINVNNVTRNYIQYLPSGFNSATETLPVVFILHGLGGNNLQMVQAGFNFVADTARIIVIYPQGVPNSFGQNSWNNSTIAASTADDMAFMTAMMNLQISQNNANPARLYLTGFSMGAITSHHFACVLNNRVAAIAPMSGTMPNSDISSCVPSYKTPVIHFHGTTDPTVPYDSNPVTTISLVPETMTFWKNVHTCSGTADSIALPNLAADNITVDRFVYQNCDAINSLELYRLNGAAHVYLYQPLNDITELLDAWRFLRQWTHTNPLLLSINETIPETITFYPNPVKNLATISVENESSLNLFSSDGKFIFSKELTKGENEISFENLSVGMYLMKVGETQFRFVKE